MRTQLSLNNINKYKIKRSPLGENVINHLYSRLFSS